MSEASEREDGVGLGFWLFSVLVAVVLGWWLAVRTMALRIGAVAGIAVPALSAGAHAGKDSVPRIPLKDRLDDYLTVKELEQYLPLCGKSIRREIAEGKLPSYRIRGKVTVKGSDALARLLASKEEPKHAKNA